MKNPRGIPEDAIQICMKGDADFSLYHESQKDVWICIYRLGKQQTRTVGKDGAELLAAALIEAGVKTAEKDRIMAALELKLRQRLFS